MSRHKRTRSRRVVVSLTTLSCPTKAWRPRFERGRSAAVQKPTKHSAQYNEEHILLGRRSSVGPFSSPLPARRLGHPANRSRQIRPACRQGCITSPTRQTYLTICHYQRIVPSERSPVFDQFEPSPGGTVQQHQVRSRYATESSFLTSIRSFATSERLSLQSCRAYIV